MDLREISPQDLADAMEISIDELWTLARNRERHFKPPRERRFGKKTRILDVPRPRFKMLLRRLHKFLQKNIGFPAVAHGGIKGRSCATSARVHCGRAEVVIRDVQDCFPSISEQNFYRRLLGLGFRRDTARLLTLLLTIRNRVPQGSPVSNDAVNLFFWATDLDLREIAGIAGGRVTRVADDIVISTARPGSSQFLGDLVDQRIEALGLKVSASKRDSRGLQTLDAPILVHSFQTNRRAGLGVSAPHRKTALEAGEAYTRAAKSVSAKTLTSVARKRAKLSGWIHYCRQVHFGPAKHLLRVLKAGDRHVERALTRAGLEAQRKKWSVMQRPKDRCELLAATWLRKEVRSPSNSGNQPEPSLRGRQASS